MLVLVLDLSVFCLHSTNATDRYTTSDPWLHSVASSQDLSKSGCIFSIKRQCTLVKARTFTYVLWFVSISGKSLFYLLSYDLTTTNCLRSHEANVGTVT